MASFHNSVASESNTASQPNSMLYLMCAGLGVIMLCGLVAALLAVVGR